MNYKLKVIVISPILSVLSFFPFQCAPSKDGGVFVSSNAGKDWRQTIFVNRNKDIANLEVNTLKLDPTDSKVIYLGSQRGGLWKSSDGGGVWYQLKDINKKLTASANVYDVAIGRQSNDIYAGAYQDRYGRLFKSEDGGKSWQESYIVARSGYAIFAVEVDPNNSAVVYVGTAEGGLFKSTNHGQSWKLIKWFSDVISDIRIDPINSQIIYVSVANRGVHKTTDGGDNWQSLENNLRNFPEADKIESLVLDKDNPNILYAGSAYGLLKTTDGGVTWQKIETIIPSRTLPISAVAINPLDANQIYYGAGAVVYKTIDGGRAWSLHNLSSSRSIRTMIIDPGNPNVIYVGMKNM